MKYMFMTILCLTAFAGTMAQESFEKDVIATEGGDLVMTFIGHGTLMFEFDGKIIHIDPVSRYADYALMPKADLILVTHHHGDHLDAEVIETISKENTDIILTAICRESIGKGTPMANGDTKTVQGIKIEAHPAYNLVHMRSNGAPYHPKGEGNSYVLTLGDKRVYIGGDTENTPEMKALENIDIAFLPMNLPYTMSPKMVVDAALAFKPKILYPYHFGRTDTGELLELLKEAEDIEIRIRDLK